MLTRMPDRNPPLLRSLKVALFLGASIVGVSAGWFAAHHYGWRWGLVAAAVGAVGGAVWSLDALIPGPVKEIGSRRSKRRRRALGPFGSTVQFTLIALGCLLAGAYISGSHGAYLERQPGGQVDLVREESWWLGLYPTHEREPDVRRVDDSRGRELIFYREEDEQHLSFVSDCPAGTAAQASLFVTDSTEPRLDLPRWNWALAGAPFCGVLALVCGWLAQRSLRQGMPMLRESLAKDRES